MLEKLCARYSCIWSVGRRSWQSIWALRRSDLQHEQASGRSWNFGVDHSEPLLHWSSSEGFHCQTGRRLERWWQLIDSKNRPKRASWRRIVKKAGQPERDVGRQIESRLRESRPAQLQALVVACSTVSLRQCISIASCLRFAWVYSIEGNCGVWTAAGESERMWFIWLEHTISPSESTMFGELTKVGYVAEQANLRWRTRNGERECCVPEVLLFFLDHRPCLRFPHINLRRSPSFSTLLLPMFSENIHRLHAWSLKILQTRPRKRCQLEQRTDAWAWRDRR